MEGDIPHTNPIGIYINKDLTLYTEYDVQRRRHKVTCDRCGSVIHLTQKGSAQYFTVHRGSIKCDRAKARRDEMKERAHAEAIAATLTSESAGPSTPQPVEPSVNASTPFHSFREQPRSGTPTPPWTPFGSALPSLFNSPRLAPTTPLPGPSTIPSDLEEYLLHSQAHSDRLSGGIAGLSVSATQGEGLGNHLDNLLASMADSASGSLPRPDTRRPPVQECRGALVEWTPGSVWSTYPYHRHASKSFPWEPVAIENNRWLRIRSEQCDGVVLEGEEVCPTCIAVPSSSQFGKVMDRAVSAAEHTPYLALTYKQLHATLRKTMGQLRELRIKHRNVERKLTTARRKISDYQRIVMLLATHDVKRLRRLLSVALKKGASPHTLIDRLERSIAGLYNAQGGFSDEELDVAFLAKALGGPRLLFALSHSHGLPSASTLGRRMAIPRLLPCISKPTESEVHANITAFCNPEFKPPMWTGSGDPAATEGIEDEPGLRPTVAGLILMVDGVALEERCRYDAERNSVLGLCREHSHRVRTKVTELDVIKDLEAALHGLGQSGVTCCYGKDGTVVAIAPYSRTDHYTPIPILLSPSCKCETGEELVEWMRIVLRVWRTHPFGERIHGPLWALGSDGESSFRRARFLLCMSELLDRGAPLGQILRNLSGLNCYTGPRGLCGTCDPKHVIKRFGTLVRNPKGITISETLLTCHDIFTHLQELPGMTTEKARQLLDPADKQNVPKAVNLLQSLLKLDEEAPTPVHPAQAHRRRILSFLAQILGYFLLPFISIRMSLSDQIRSLATYAHLVAVFWIKHGTKFITGALYADSQAIIKNIIFSVARLQLVDKNLPFHIILEGTDRLETLFGDCRTQDHSRNFDALQLSEKLATGTLIQGIFERHPDLDRGHRRLALKDAMGVDRVNPKSWMGNVRVGDVELAAEWARGREEANKVLEAYLGPSARVDFEAVFPLDGDRDLLRPLGTYVGCDYDPDDARTEAPEMGSALGSYYEDSGLPTETSPAQQDTDEESPNAFKDVPEGVSLDDFLPRNVGERPSQRMDSTLMFSEDNFLMIDGKAYLKASVVTIFLTAKRSRKVTMRILRARGVTIEDLRGRGEDLFNSAVDLDGEDLIKIGDIAAVLIRIGDVVCLAVVEILEFQVEGGKLTAVNTDQLEQEASPVKVLVQVLRMRRVQDLSDGTDTRWLWDHHYALFDAKSDGQSTRSKEPKRTFLIPGFLVFPLGPTIVSTHQPVSTTGQPSSSSEMAAKDTVTWSLSDAQLQAALDAAWNALSPTSDAILTNIELLPSAAKSDALPYQSEDGAHLTVQDVPESLSVEKLSGTAMVPCFLCGDTMALSRMRNHVGHHILLSMRDIEDDKDLLQDVGIEPCGFCGREDTCTTHLSKSGSTYKVSSSCRYHYASMSYASACKSTATTPSTNVPIHCPLCPVQSPSGEPITIWKYNAMVHLLIQHLGDEASLPDLPPSLILDMHISKAEELAMGVATEWTDKWRDENAIPDSDGIEEVQAQLASDSIVQKRGRAQSTAEGVERRRKTVRTRL